MSAPLIVNEESHERPWTLSHAIVRTKYVEATYTGGKLTALTTYTDSGKGTKLRETLLTYSGDNLATVTQKQYDASGSLLQTLTRTVTLSSGALANTSDVLS